MRFAHTLAAARGVEETTWAVADGLVEDFRESGVVSPTTLHFKEAAEALEAAGYTYNPKTLNDYWRVASTFSRSRRRSKVSVTVYTEILGPLWVRLDSDTRSNDLVSYATQFFRTEPKPSLRTARAWAKSQADALDAERKAREEAEEKRRLKKQLAEAEAVLNAHIEADNMDAAREVLAEVNLLRGRLGMDLVKLDTDDDQTQVEVDEKATEQAQQESDEARLHAEARAEVEAGIAKVGAAIAYLGHTYLRHQEHLTADDRDAYAEEIETEEGRLALVRAKFGGLATDDALAAALAEWSS